jgi:hypothetical protein
LRHTGIRFMGDMPWGTHVCLFFETPQDLLDTAVCYFEAGLKSNEFCVWAVSDPISLPQAEKALRRAVPGFDRHRAAGQIELISGSEWYLNGDKFDLQPITDGWREKLGSALAKGFAGMRERKCILAGDETLEGVLRMRARTRSIARRSEDDHALHPFVAGKPDRRHARRGACASMFHRAPQRQLGFSGDARTQAGETGNQTAE